MLKQLTQGYIKAFGEKNLTELDSMLHKDFILMDTEIKKTSPNGLKGKETCLNAMGQIFKSCNTLVFKAKNIFVCNNTSLIEFSLQIDTLLLEGVDIIEWEKQGDTFIMKELRAYLDMPKG